MRLHTASRLLLGLGLTVGAVGSAGVLAGVDPVAGAGWLVDVAIYKLVFIASGGLLVAGGLVGRWANRARLASRSVPGALAEPSAPSHRALAAPGAVVSPSETSTPASDDST